jgi:hypothetical protein
MTAFSGGVAGLADGSLSAVLEYVLAICCLSLDTLFHHMIMILGATVVVDCQIYSEAGVWCRRSSSASELACRLQLQSCDGRLKWCSNKGWLGAAVPLARYMFCEAFHRGLTYHCCGWGECWLRTCVACYRSSLSPRDSPQDCVDCWLNTYQPC